MVRIRNAYSMALVAMLCLAICVADQISAGFVPRSARHAHRGLRKALVAKRASADCPEGNTTLGSFVQDQIKKLSSASAQRGGQEQVKEATLPGDRGTQHVQVKAKSAQDGSARSWSWSWSSHSSSSSTSSSTSSSSSSSSSDSTSKRTDESAQQDRSSEQPKEEQIKRESQSNKPKQPSPPAVVQSETHSSHTRRTSDSSHHVSSSSTDKNGNVVKHSSNTKKSSSWSTSSYSHSMNVFQYVISGNTEKWINAAPFSNAQVEWAKSPANLAALMVSPAVGVPIARPAKADTCNRRFPFTGKQYTAEDRDHRFNSAFPKEALDPVSKAALDLHNAERARYGLVPLEWNVELANMASCWADLKAYGHSEDHFCAAGENIAMGLGDPCYSNPLEGMKNGDMSFLDEDRNWAQNPHMAENNGHWTQAVWKDTRFVGCAVAQRKDFMQSYSPDDKASMYVVCEYYPPGNVMGQFETQVPAVRPLPQLRSACSANERHGS